MKEFSVLLYEVGSLAGASCVQKILVARDALENVFGNFKVQSGAHNGARQAEECQ